MGFFFKRRYTLFELCCDCYDGNKLKEISFDINEKLQGAELVKFVLPQLRLKYEEIEENEDDETEELQEYIDEIEDGDLSNLDYVCHEYEIVAVPLFIAIKQENTNLVIQLLQNGADVNKSFDGIFPIIYAASCGNIDIVKLLIEEGANIDVLDEDQKPLIYLPMIFSDYDDKRKVFEYLLKITDLNKKYKKAFISCLVFLSGMFIPMLLFSIYFLLAGGFKEFIDVYFKFNKLYKISNTAI